VHLPADTEEPRAWGWTPLHVAASQEHAGAAELLLRAGAQLNARTASGDTPLDLAWGSRGGEVKSVLEEAGGKR